VTLIQHPLSGAGPAHFAFLMDWPCRVFAFLNPLSFLRHCGMTKIGFDMQAMQSDDSVSTVICQRSHRMVSSSPQSLLLTRVSRLICTTKSDMMRHFDNGGEGVV
jgi:hypothetical protein